MKKYAQIINDEDKSVSVGVGTDVAFYASIGMTEMDVEQGYDGQWYVAGYAPVKPLETLRKEKLTALNEAFTAVESGAWVMSSLGFKADANTTANTNIEGLIKSMSALGQETVIFCDYDNVYREVTLEGLQTLQLEVIQNGQSLYAQKWAFRNIINTAQTKEELDAVQIEFSMMDFSA